MKTILIRPFSCFIQLPGNASCNLLYSGSEKTWPFDDETRIQKYHDTEKYNILTQVTSFLDIMKHKKKKYDTKPRQSVVHLHLLTGNQSNYHHWGWCDLYYCSQKKHLSPNCFKVNIHTRG